MSLAQLELSLFFVFHFEKYQILFLVGVPQKVLLTLGADAALL